MNLPFDSRQFLDVFKDYNNSVFPVQVLFLIMAVFAVLATLKNHKYSGKIAALILGFLWLWTGVVYHILFFTAINKAAYLFGMLFIVQAALIMYYGFFKSGYSFGSKLDVGGYIGMVLITYALLIYPVIGYFSGHVYPRSPTFGLPCPTTIFTFGLLMLANRKFPFTLMIIPLIWSVIGLSAAVLLGMYEDFGLPAAGLTALTMYVSANHIKNETSIAPKA